MVAQVVSIVAGVIVDDAGRVLLVRKAGTRAFMQPGGKRAPGESDLQTLRRELSEELRCAVGSAAFVGHFRAAAANEPGAIVEAALYRVALEGHPMACAEIEEIVWVDPHEAMALELAPLTQEHVLPLVSVGS